MVLCRDGGRFFAKMKRADTFWQEGRPGMLALEDPRDPSNDLAKGSYNYERQIRPALDFAYQQLSAPSRSDESILARIVRRAARRLRAGAWPQASRTGNRLQCPVQRQAAHPASSHVLPTGAT